ncbi:uncharacterized protein A1O5_04849 [Cladophialophora psammophila CBS 110553]|uniref:Uncharacterized protein n=1 Tax=Cladophialophora psammophila CBS 110553 TaxID=1182543 RepID=W9X4Y0_9EURO|nr:uncharacterized protein A1O5_04849 [Cladophialophora psammophila CBS 110553]EXJ72345.1 hypothetical protein A1O5_04849 [Cladophialophora psammophila CBS 110553]
MIAQIVKPRPEHRPEIQANSSFQAPTEDTLEEIKAAFKSVQEESRQLQELLGAAEQANQDFFCTYRLDIRPETSDEGKFRNFIRAFVDLHSESEAVIEWEALESSWTGRINQARQWTKWPNHP